MESSIILQGQPPSSPLSSPLSMLSNSPSLPPSPLLLDAAKRYPSPSSSSAINSGSASPMKPSAMLDNAPGEIQVRTDGPPTKRRRLAAPPRPRTTEYIDLETRGDDDDEQESLARLLTALRKKKRIVVIAGAGISVSAGIPDFRSATGLFTTLRGQHKLKSSGKHLFDASVYKHDSSTASFHAMVRDMAQLTSKASPTPFHQMLASIAQEGRLMRLYSQNIDSIDTQMAPLATAVPLNIKGPWPTTIQLHGGLEKMVCSKCGHLEPFNASLFEGPEPPPCEKCTEQDQVRTTFAGKRSHGIGRLRPRIVLYNEYNPDEEAIGNVSKADLRRVPDAVIVVGTSLKIPGVRRIVKEMCQLTRSRRDGLTAWINLDPEPPGTEFKDCWDLVIRGKCDDIAELVNLPRWDQQDIGDRDSYMVTGDEEKERRREALLNRDRLEVPLKRKRKNTPDDSSESSQGEQQHATADAKTKPISHSIPTPSASPRPRSPLPPAKPKAASKLLTFGTLAASRTKPDVGPVKAQGTLAAKKKSRQPKKGAAAKPKNTIQFKSTKAGAAVGGNKILQKNALVDVDPPNTPPSIESQEMSLPSLRPTLNLQKEEVVELPLSSSPLSSPTTPVTISPSSKPRSMGHLID
ncbi:DHS-like NAD/FAD-binding domain-containing protein [Podospora appendiculata]|uniref:DHS-like NAD/FAD-binding domain-containing protein n=1 Tax=Podospora appendiculata TaxID=314037 RepID=A0AAE0XJG7_9PEZI|nr:DHS-like NAD/FAD-binding domain-containing protein [Podospora appendiculata]